MELERNKARLAELGLGVCSISYDSVEILRDFATRRGITIPMLSDPDSAIIRRFGLFNEQIQQGTRECGIPHPATILADTMGIVRYKVIDEPYIHRMRFATLLYNLRDIFGKAGQTSLEIQPQPRTTGDGAGGRFTIEVAATEAMLYPGNVATLFIDVRPAAGTIVLRGEEREDHGLMVEFEESPFFKVRGPRYPPASPLWVRPLNATVLGYVKPLRVEAGLALANRFDLQPVFDAGGRLEVRATLRLRTCDQETCYPPETVPLLWTFPLIPPDLERPPEPLRHEARLQHSQ